MVHAGIMLAAPSSGSGKTTIVCALLAALKKQNRKVRSFKCGPDYIDPMFHERVLHVPSRNLDTFFSDGEQLQKLYRRGEEEVEFSIIEGAMGLYDGLGGVKKEGSAYHLAEILNLPIILVMDAHGMGRTMVSVLAGIREYDKSGLIAGVILNRTGEGVYQSVRGVIEEELKLPVLGYFPQQKEFHIESRHLGLKMPQEMEGLQNQVEAAAGQLEKTVNIEKLLEIAAEFAADSGKKEENRPEKSIREKEGTDGTKPAETVRIAVAADAAFCFYYEDNLQMLREMGAKLVPFSPLADKMLPENIDGILLGGGYPELYAKELSENVSMRRSIWQAVSGGMPSLAECGGFMYLHDSITVENGTFPMAGVVAGNCRNTGKLVRFGYVEIREKEPVFLQGGIIKGHEFHYYDSDCNGDLAVAKKPVSEKSWDCVHKGKNHWWGYPHLYYPSNPAFAEHFIRCAREWKKKRAEQTRESACEYSEEKLNTEIINQKHNGKLYGIGVGPGEPELMTIKAVQAVKACDVLVLPAASKDACYSYQIVEQICPEAGKMPVLCLPFPMTRDEKKLAAAHAEIYAKIENALETGHKVGLLTIGDPSVYSTYMYMHRRALEAGWQVQMISGVPSFCAAAARLGISLGENADEIHIIPAAYDILDSLAFTGTRVYMKSGRKLEELILLLQKEEQTKHCEIYGVSNCGMGNEKVYYGLEELKSASGYLTTVIVKDC